MEIFILILSSLISLLSPVNLAADKVAASAIRSQFKSVEQLQVRIDNAPVHQSLAGKVDRVRIAGRGLFPFEGVRLEALEVETDPIAVDRRQLWQQKRKLVLKEPLGVGVRTVIRAQDLVEALKSPVAARQIRQLLGGGFGLGGRTGEATDSYQIVNPRVVFLDNQRVEIAAEIEQGQSGKLRLEVATGIEVIEGRRIQFVDPIVKLDGQPLPDQLVKGLAASVARQFDLDRVETRSQIRAKILRLRFAQNSLELAAFVALPAGFKI